MGILKVGETVELPYGGNLTQIKSFWPIGSKIKLRNTECEVDRLQGACFQ